MALLFTSAYSSQNLCITQV